MQNIKKYFMTLALLLTAVTGAWAQDALTVKELVPPATWANDDNPVAAADLPGFKVSTLAEAEKWTGAPKTGMALLFYDFAGADIKFTIFSGGQYVGNGTQTFLKSSTSNYKYFYTTELTEWSLTPDADKKVWTLAKMPANDIELQVEYFAESYLYLSKDVLADKASIAVTAGDLGVQFGEDGKSANTVTEGTAMTVKYNGTKKVLGMKVEKVGAGPLAAAFKDGAKFKVGYQWNFGYTTYLEFTNSGGTYSLTSVSGLNEENGFNSSTLTVKNGNVLALDVVCQPNGDRMDEFCAQIEFDATSSTYKYSSKGSKFTGIISVSVNDTDITSQLTKEN